MSQLMVGAGKACITPPADMFPMHRYETVYFEGILADLYARAVLLDNGSERFLFISTEADPALYKKDRQAIADEYKIPEDHIMTTCCHNHSAPHWGDRRSPYGDDREADLRQHREYGKIVMNGVRRAIDGAISSLKPARYGYGTGESYINTNRDELFEDGYWMQSQNYGGISDKTLAVMKFEDLDGNLIAVVLNYCCHGTTAFCVKDTDGKVKLTPGFMGYACDFVEKRFAGAVEPVVLWTSGAAGDQNPLFSSEGFPRVYELDGYTESIPTPPGTQYMIQKHWGYTHAMDTIRALKNIICTKSSMEIRTATTTVELQGQRAPEGVDMQLNRLFCDNFVRLYRPELFEGGKRPEKKLATMIPEGVVPLPMQLAVLGDVAFVGAAAEPYVEIGLKCKAASPFKNTVIVTHTAAEKAGYILSDAAACHTVFQSFSKVRPGNNDKPIVDGMLKMFEDVLN
ncbi:MAG: neutral/alkaline non-lysosomal ceramidase N-terminal domain-containing protein [Enterocloster asparagiformis]|nr:neutral/alkaline non-lysosomal ceramidase N-terminal domain-containing protein [Enterocloster asparagiformis]